MTRTDLSKRSIAEVLASSAVWYLLMSCYFVDAGFAFLDEEDKRQDLVPFPRVGRTLWATLDDVGIKRQGLVPFPRVGRETKRQGLIPFPRIGRGVLWDDPDIDSDLPSETGETATNGGIALWLVPYKRNPLTFTPRIGRRKKRSLAVEQNSQHKEDVYDGLKPSWQFLDWVQGRSDDESIHPRQLIPVPRVGKRAGETTIHLRSAFVPRLGRKRSDPQQDYYQVEDFRDEDNFSSPDELSYPGEKRGAFTPRIGRAPFTPRIGRRSDGSNIRVKVQGRAFTPRIGRSGGEQIKETGTDLKSGNP